MDLGQPHELRPRSISQQWLGSTDLEGALLGSALAGNLIRRSPGQQEPSVVSGDSELATRMEKESYSQVLREKTQRVKQPSILEAIFAGVSLCFISVTVSHLLLNQSCWGNGVKLREIRGRNGSGVYINICLYYIEYCS